MAVLKFLESQALLLLVFPPGLAESKEEEKGAVDQSAGRVSNPIGAAGLYAGSGERPSHRTAAAPGSPAWLLPARTKRCGIGPKLTAEASCRPRPPTPATCRPAALGSALPASPPCCMPSR